MNIKKATKEDLSRIAEIFVFNNRINYFPIFKQEDFSFGELQVVSLIENYFGKTEIMDTLFVAEDNGIIKGFMEIRGTEIGKLYVEPCFQSGGVIDKSLAAQKERIAKNAKTRAEEKKAAEKKADKKKTEEKQELKNDKSKKAEEKEDYVTVTASSVEELLKKINDTIYDSMSDHVKTPQEQLLGQHINFSA